MGLFIKKHNVDINSKVAEYRQKENAVLLDVRKPEEFAEKHISGSRNIPLQTLGTVTEKISDKSTPIYVYCRSGGRSSQAAGFLRSIGYLSVTNIGGIIEYSGDTEKLF